MSPPTPSVVPRACAGLVFAGLLAACTTTPDADPSPDPQSPSVSPVVVSAADATASPSSASEPTGRRSAARSAASAAADRASLFSQKSYDRAWNAVTKADVGRSLRYVRVEEHRLIVVDDLKRTWTWDSGSISGPEVWAHDPSIPGTGAVLFGASFPISEARITDIPGLLALAHQPSVEDEFGMSEPTAAEIAKPHVLSSELHPGKLVRALHVFRPAWGPRLEAGTGLREAGMHDSSVSARVAPGASGPLLHQASDADISALFSRAGDGLRDVALETLPTDQIIVRWSVVEGNAVARWSCSPCRLTGIGLKTAGMTAPPKGATAQGLRAAHAWGQKIMPNGSVRVRLSPTASTDAKPLVVRGFEISSERRLGTCTLDGQCTRA